MKRLRILQRWFGRKFGYARLVCLALLIGIAALRIAEGLGGIWRLARILRFVPWPVRDAVYDWIARNRYRWFGKRAHCMAPTPALRSRFID